MNFRYVSYIFSLIFAFAQIAWAMPPATTYQAKIVKPDGYPLEAPTVNFKFSFLDPSGSCILYSESYFSVNMAGTGGLISFPLGSGTRSYPASGTLKLSDIFNNRAASFTCATGGPASYTPLANDIRKIIMQFHDGTSWQTLPAMAINSVPYAMYAGSADDSATLNGKADTDFVEKVNIPSCTGADVLTFNGVSFSCVAAGSSVTSSTVVAALGYTPMDGASYSTITSLLSAAQSDLAAVSSSVYSVSLTVSGLSSSLTSLSSALNNRITSSAASVAEVLGYTPANSATVTTLQNDLLAVSASANSALLKTNNLSDLSNVATARTNLGLGAFATANSVDLGSASATGIIADARLANQSNVSSGTQYTKVTVDSKGRVTSGAQLSANDVTTALGYTPQASGVISSQWNTSGTTINYTAGGVGIGTSSPAVLLHLAASNTAVTGGLLLTDTNSGGSLHVKNGTGAANQFLPIFQGFPIGATRFSGFYSDILSNDDTGTVATIALTGRSTSGAVTNRPILAVNNNSTNLLTILASGAVGVGTTTPVTKLDISGGVRISMEAATCAASYAGTLRYNAGNVEFCNGTTWAAFGVSSSGLTSLNGSTSQTQTFGYGTMGNFPNFLTSNGVHILNLPNASSTASVTAGLISNADYVNFSNKITSSAASIAQVLGYTPASSTSLGNYLGKTNNLSDLANTATARTNLGLGDLATANTLDLGSASATGTIADARLANQSNVSSGTQYTKVTVDGKGRVTSGAQLSASDVTTALGYTPQASGSLASQWTVSGTLVNTTYSQIGISGTQVVYLPDQTNLLGSLFIGNGGRSAITGASSNTATGMGALYANTSGYGNTANGSGALFSNTTGSNNTANGLSALFSNTTGGSNVAIGESALYANTSGYSNVAVGRSSLSANTTGYENSANGQYALGSNKTGSANTANGFFALYNNTTGNSNSAFGHQALYSNKTKVQSVAVGYFSMYYADSVSAAPAISYNTAIGSYSLQGSSNAANNTGTMNTALGHSALMGMTSGSGNIGVGYNAGSAITTGNYNVVIGANTGSSIATTSNTVLIADGQGNERLRINSSGNVGIGTAAPTAALHLPAGTASTAPFKLTSGTLLTSPQSGTIEYDGFNFYVTNGANVRSIMGAGAGGGTVSGSLTQITDVMNASGTISLAPATSVIVSSTVASTDPTTGALIVKGGVGVSGSVYASGTITSLSSLIGPYIYGSTVSGGSLVIDSTTQTSKGNITLAPNGGGVGIGITPTTSNTLTVSGNMTTSGRMIASVVANSSALGSITADFKNTNFVRATGASANCGTLNVTNTSPGGTFTITIPNATATCTTINWNGAGTNIKLPVGYGSGGLLVSGVIYSFVDDGAYLWVSFVPY